MRRLIVFAFAMLYFVLPTQARSQETEAAAAASEPATDVADMVETPAALPDETEVEEASWKANCELGGTLTAGNARSGLLTTGCGAGREWSQFKLSSEGNVNFGRTRYGGQGTYPTGQPVTEGEFRKTQLNMSLQLREDYYLDLDKKSYLYALQGLSQDKFAGYKMRFVAELGAGRVYFESETQRHAVEVGFQYERERFVVTQPTDHDNRYGMVASVLGATIFSEHAMFEYIVTYTPSFQASEDWRLDGKGGFNFKINDRLSFKTGLTVAYDHEPSLINPLDPNGAVIVGANPVPAKNTDIIWNNVLVVALY